MIRCRLSQAETEKVSQRQRVRHPPGNASLGVDTFQEAQQQHSEINARGQPWSAHGGGIEALAKMFQPAVELVLVEDLADLGVKRVTCRFYDIRGSHKQTLLFRLALAHCHKTIILQNVLLTQAFSWALI